MRVNPPSSLAFHINPSSSTTTTTTTSTSTMGEEIIVNDVGNSLDLNPDSLLDEDAADLPASLIITNLDLKVFECDQQKAAFEKLFEPFGEASFVYFKSFHRVRVNFLSSQVAAAARIQLHQAQVGDRQMNCYFAQVSSPKGDDKSDAHLQPPTPVKQYLISPPASPPVGWEPVDESAPIINYDLVTALANLSPAGEPQELHPPSGSQPGIVVHGCGEAEKAAGGEKAPKVKIPHTPRPEKN